MKKRNKFKLVIYVILIFTLLFIGLWCWNRSILDISTTIDDVAFNSFGAFFGGVVGTIVLIVTLRVAYLTYQENAKNQIEIRYFQLLELITDKRKDLRSIDDNIFAIYEKNIVLFFQKIETYNSSKVEKWLLEDMLKLAYLFFFYGVDEFDEIKLKNIKTIDRKDVALLKGHMIGDGVEYYNPAYKDIGIYFRQLYQAVTFIDNRVELDYAEKYNLIKTLRVQLNIEEQYLLFVNSLVSVGLDWEKNKTDDNKKLITKYNLIKNLPRNYQPVDGIYFQDRIYGYPNVHYEFMGDEKYFERKDLERKYK